MCMCVYVSFVSLATCIVNTTDELAMQISKGDIAVLQTSDLGLFWHYSCRLDTKFEQGLG